jgi:peptidoglycan hydrolase-like protein with peptidoglycan-binding domain
MTVVVRFMAVMVAGLGSSLGGLGRKSRAWEEISWVSGTAGDTLLADSGEPGTGVTTTLSMRLSVVGALALAILLAWANQAGATVETTPDPAGDAPIARRAAAIGPVNWLSEEIAVVGTDVVVPVSGPISVAEHYLDPAVAPIRLEPGVSGPAVERLQQLLIDHGMFRGTIDGDYGRETAGAVVAVHKVLGMPREEIWFPEDWNLIETLDHTEILARNPDEPDRIEVDISRQVLFVIRDDAVTAVLPVSSGNGERYWSANGGPGGGYVTAETPRGDYRLFKHLSGWKKNYLGELYKPWYFTPYYAIHGSGRVPPEPASHGCVRIPTWESNHMDSYLKLGMPVHIWDGPASVIPDDGEDAA